MADVKKKHKAHQRYYVDGKQVPGVTTITGMLDKPALKYWANSLGLNGIDVRNYVDDMAEIGTCAHYMIECDVRGETPDLDDYSKNTINAAENGYLKWLEWKREHNVEPIGSELQLVSNNYRYGGTCDIPAVIDGTTGLIDIKTSGSGIYPEMQLQTAAYWNLMIENGYECEDVRIVRVGRSDDEGIESKRVEKLETWFNIFTHLRAVYQLKKEVGWK